jgi:hypothetical protein
MARRKRLTQAQEDAILVEAGRAAMASRKALGLTQKDVVEDIGITNTALSNFERGKNYLPPGTAHREQAFATFLPTVFPLCSVLNTDLSAAAP